MITKSKSKKEYLRNKICSFEPLFDIDYSIKTNFICTVLFDMKRDAYRSFGKYLVGINKYKMIIDKYLQNWKLRIFIDDTITSNNELMSKLQSDDNSHLQLVKFNCPNYKMNNNSDRHKGTFGTIIRLFPFFDFPNNDAGIILCEDLDFDEVYRIPYIINKIHIMKYLILNNNLVNKSFHLCTSSMNHFHENEKRVVEWIIMPDFISYYIKVDKNIIYNFFNYLDKKDTKIYVEHYMKDIKDYVKKHSNNDIGQKFGYGIDEYFLNYHMLKQINDNIIILKSYNFRKFIEADLTVRFRHIVYKDNIEGGNQISDNNSYNTSPINNRYITSNERLHNKYVKYLLQDIVKDGIEFIKYHILYTIIYELLYTKFEYGLVKPLVSNKINNPNYYKEILDFKKGDNIYYEKFDILLRFYKYFFKLMIHINNSKNYTIIFTPLRVKTVLKNKNLGIIRREYINAIIDGKHNEYNYVYKKLEDKDIEELKKLKKEKFIIKELL